MMLGEHDPDSRDCPYPECEESFYTIDGKEWSKYANHLKGHLLDELGYICKCEICGERVYESDEDTDKFDPMRPMWVNDIEEYDNDAVHLGCSDAMFDETHAEVDGFSEVTSANLEDDQ